MRAAIDFERRRGDDPREPGPGPLPKMPHMDPGSTIIIASINSDGPNPTLPSNAFDPVDPAGRGCNLFGKQVAMKRPDQPAELATAYVMLAHLLASYISGAAIAVTGGKPIL